MANKVFWQTETSASVLTTELNSITNGSSTALGTEYDNATNQFRWALFELLVSYAVAPTAGTTWDFYMFPAMDGTNYVNSAQQVSDNLIGRFTVDDLTADQRYPLFGHLNGGGMIIPIPPFPLKFIAVNNTGQTSDASGNTVDIYPFNEEVQ